VHPPDLPTTVQSLSTVRINHISAFVLPLLAFKHDELSEKSLSFCTRRVSPKHMQDLLIKARCLRSLCSVVPAKRTFDDAPTADKSVSVSAVSEISIPSAGSIAGFDQLFPSRDHSVSQRIERKVGTNTCESLAWTKKTDGTITKGICRCQRKSVPEHC
jgi:hypothetical protein